MIRFLFLALALIALPAAAGLDVDVIRSITGNVPLSAHNASLGALETSNGGTTTYYTTTGDKTVGAVGAGLVKRVINATGTSITVTFFDDADGTCNSNQKSGTITLTNGTVYELGFEFSNAICMAVGGTSPTLTVVSLP